MRNDETTLPGVSETQQDQWFYATMTPVPLRKLWIAIVVMLPLLAVFGSSPLLNRAERLPNGAAWEAVIQEVSDWHGVLQVLGGTAPYTWVQENFQDWRDSWRP